jgi:hypothetical protein
LIQILLIAAITLAIISLPAYFRLTKDKRQRFNQLIFLAIILFLLGRILPGLFGLMIPLVAALVAGLVRLLPVLIRYAPFLHRIWLSWKQQYRSTTDQRTDNSTIETLFLRIQLDHTGQPISGEVITGSLSGRQLNSLNSAEFAQLMKLCISDKQSIILLQRFIQGSGSRSSSTHRKPSATGQMTTDQAYKVLGVETNASRQQIISAHRRLIQKAHPDHGGSDELAAQINQARDVLLKQQ